MANITSLTDLVKHNITYEISDIKYYIGHLKTGFRSLDNWLNLKDELKIPNIKCDAKVYEDLKVIKDDLSDLSVAVNTF